LIHKHLDRDAKERNPQHVCLLFYVRKRFEASVISASVDPQAAVYWTGLFWEMRVSFDVSSATPASDVCLSV
jgi:hypothetical protein